MMITKMALPRRTFLRGMGAAVGLPLLDAMVPALSAMTRTAANPARRLAFVYIPNGAYHAAWTPEATGAGFALSPSLEPLEAVRDQVVVVSNLAHRQLESLGDGGGDHSRASAGWLSGVHAKRTEGADVAVGTTADQIAAREIGQSTPLASLELALDAADIVGHCDAGYACAYMNTISWRTPTTPNPMERNPRAVFERLFGAGDSAADRLREMQMDRSILDSVTEEVGRLEQSLGAGDRRRVTEYLEAIRETERRIQKTEHYNSTRELAVPGRPIGVPEDFETHAKLMIDLQVLALSGRPDPCHHVCLRARSQLPDLPGNRGDRPTSRAVAPPEQRTEACQPRQGQHLSRPDVRLLLWTSCEGRRTAMARCWTTRCCSTAAA